MHVLRNMVEAIKLGGVVLDLQVIRPNPNVEVAQPTKRGKVRPLRVEHATHVRAAGLYAFTVVPRAPNFCAFRRVSSNFERA